MIKKQIEIIVDLSKINKRNLQPMLRLTGTRGYCQHYNTIISDGSWSGMYLLNFKIEHKLLLAVIRRSL